MKKCLNCKKEFKYTQVLRSVLPRFKWQLVSCNDCGKGHKITFSSRSVVSILITAFPILLVQYVFQEPSFFRDLLWFSAWVITILAISPYIIKYKE
ncbi:TIGR04104 family putative zinc finger protein [Paenibacillus sp. FA6]|uniref:TIGR04104 family putative zinc finger protein n=1 Tax=Paenibacillus sp. FA6 TaxID=3413029 RepID=UPI003F6604DE